jgi:hypothetical protein
MLSTPFFRSRVKIKRLAKVYRSSLKIQRLEQAKRSSLKSMHSTPVFRSRV